MIVEKLFSGENDSMNQLKSCLKREKMRKEGRKGELKSLKQKMRKTEI